MTEMKIKGCSFRFIPTKDSHNRRATQYENKIVAALNKLGIPSDDIEVSEERHVLQAKPADVTWYFDGYKFYYSYAREQRYVDNLFVVMRVIETQIRALEKEEKTVEEFLTAFKVEHNDLAKERKEARELLGVPEDCHDLDLINKTYKKLAKNAHPDMNGGSHEEFKKLNHAHKVLRKELS